MNAKLLPDSRTFRLADGTPAVTRPITPADADALSRGLTRLSPEGNAHRFLHHRARFTSVELQYLTNCDFVDHVALILGILDSRGREVDQVGVARWIRTSEDAKLAEVAVVIIDEWQRLEGGTALLQHLAALAWERGIRKWQTLRIRRNVAASRILARLGEKTSQRYAGNNTTEEIFTLAPPKLFPPSVA